MRNSSAWVAVIAVVVGIAAGWWIRGRTEFGDPARAPAGTPGTDPVTVSTALGRHVSCAPVTTPRTVRTTLTPGASPIVQFPQAGRNHRLVLTRHKEQNQVIVMRELSNDSNGVEITMLNAAGQPVPQAKRPWGILHLDPAGCAAPDGIMKLENGQKQPDPEGASDAQGTDFFAILQGNSTYILAAGDRDSTGVN